MMRLGFSLRTALIAFTIITLLIAHFASRWRRGDFEYQREQAVLAYRDNLELNRLSMRIASERAIGIRPGAASLAAAGRVEMLRKRSEEARRNLRWHRRLAGPAYEREVYILEFQRQHEMLADGYLRQVMMARMGMDYSLTRPESTNAQITSRVAQSRKRMEDAERDFLRHRRLAGPESRNKGSIQ